MLTVAMLGPVELRRDGELLAVPAGKTTELLIRLALDAGLPVRTDRLIEELWSAQAAGVARNTVQAKVSRLRRVLGDARLLSGDSTGYTLHVDPAGVDALEVLRIAGAGFGSAGPESVRHATATALVACRPPFTFSPRRTDARHRTDNLRSPPVNSRRSWSCGWRKTGRVAHMGNHNSKIAEEVGRRGVSGTRG